MQSMLNLWCTYLVENNIISKNDIEIYAFGMRSTITSFLFYSIVGAFGLLTHQFINSIFVLVVFSLLRPYAGGIHLQSRALCSIFSVSIALIILGASKILNVAIPRLDTPLLLAGSIIILLFSPVDTPNKRLSHLEKQVYRKNCLQLTLLFCLFYFNLL